jgi:acetyl-CoA carboxylase carboxyl transferase subunit alpha
MKMAERFKIPIIYLIDTPGAYPGIGAEERGQSEAIARNLFEMTTLKTPIICTVIGEGGSGGALAIGVGDRLIMLEFSTYAVISPEGCASILWKSDEKSQLAAEAMGITSDRVREQGLLDEVVREPLGGGHRNYQKIALSLRETLIRHLDELKQEEVGELLAKRYQRIMHFGSYVEEVAK